MAAPARCVVYLSVVRQAGCLRPQDVVQVVGRQRLAQPEHEAQAIVQQEGPPDVQPLTGQGQRRREHHRAVRARPPHLHTPPAGHGSPSRTGGRPTCLRGTLRCPLQLCSMEAPSEWKWIGTRGMGATWAEHKQLRCHLQWQACASAASVDPTAGWSTPGTGACRWCPWWVRMWGLLTCAGRTSTR
jgi:hypothetical protein